jgi:diguanylate cyclase (GGDEF)-like protein
MKAPECPADEVVRLETLRGLQLLGSESEERFDRLTRLARRMFGVSTALVTLVDSDRQWCKSAQGCTVSSIARDISFCGHAILGDKLFVVPDAQADTRFHDNPLVTDAPHIRFYAGCPISFSNGAKLGTLCLIDQQPREFTLEDQQVLQDLATMVEQEIAAIQLATLDDLTLISNRKGFIDLANHALSFCARCQFSVAVLILDLDGFKRINDTLGRIEGDRALIDFAKLMQEVFRDSDVLARLGGDEFAVLLSKADENSVTEMLARFDLALIEFNRCSDRGYALQCSVGYTISPKDRKVDIESLFIGADRQMYRHKESKAVTSALESQFLG